MPTKQIVPAIDNLSDQKERALAIAKHELEKEQERSDQWFILKVGILSLEGKGLQAVAVELGYKTANWTKPRRKAFIEYMQATHNIDTALFMPESPSQKNKNEHT